MSKKTILAAGTSPFAHLLGGAAALAGRALGKRSAEDDTPDPDAEEEEDNPDAEEEDNDPAAEEDTPDPDADEDEDADPDAEEEDPDEKAKKAKKSAEFKRGYAAANRRARAIFASPVAAGRPDLAAQLAFETTQTSAEAIGVLGMAGPGATKGRTLDERMGTRREARPGAGGAGAGADNSFAAQVLAASKKAGRRS